MKKLIWAVLFFCAASIPAVAFAHENYVLTEEEIKANLAVKGINVFSSLNNSVNLKIALLVGAALIILVTLYFFFQHSAVGQKFNDNLNKLEPFGHVILRFALAASLIASAYFNAFLGPEIPLSSLPVGMLIKPALYILGALLIIGLWSEFTAAVSLFILLVATWVYKDYMVTYFNYHGEFIALILFGSRTFSLDKLIFKIKNFALRHHDAELALIRITYGISVIYPAITYKLMHPQVIIDIANRYNLMQFTWLFPQDPLLIALGTGLTQVGVGLALILGFQTRLNTLITFVLMLMSVIFFKEAVWPHIVLLALAFYLFLNNGGKWSLDNFIQKKLNMK